VNHTVTVFGLGEAGSLIAADLAGAGAVVHGYDPADVATPQGVERHGDPKTAVRGSGLVMAITAAVDAQAAIAQAWDVIGRGTVYADLSTAPPSLKEDLDDTATLRGLQFADVALMAPVPGRGLATPSYASGAGAVSYAEAVNPFGAQVEVVGDAAGTAATRKLIRSVFMKGLTAVLIEATRTAEAAGEGEWFWEHVADVVGEELLVRMVSSTATHSARRLEEMEAATQLLEILGVDPVMTRSTVESLRRIPEEGVPAVGGDSVP
jgi:3-hydroxyisobutyrate dehydrogenase-like beta-hydroxyacid dehydrogenase